LEEPRIGVYVCNCGINIGAVVNVDSVAEYAKTLPYVVVSRTYVYMCSDPGQELIKKDIKEFNLNRVVVASCSPRMHEPTFRAVLEEVGMNKYLYEHVNLREHCSWVHMHEPEKATDKAKDLVRMAVARAALLEPQEKREVDVVGEALVIGGGISGIQSSLDLADSGFKVHLVERGPSLGGRVAQLHKLYPVGEEARKMLKEKMDQVWRHPQIDLMPLSEVSEVGGYIGNYTVKVKKNPRIVDSGKCTTCRKCVQVCPVDVPNEFNLGLDTRKAIYLPFREAVPNSYVVDLVSCTRCGKCVEACPEGAINFGQKPQEVEFKVGTIVVASGGGIFDAAMKKEYGFGKLRGVVNNLQLNRILDPDGPTRGQLVRFPDGRVPKRVAFIQCVGSRDPEIGIKYCSRYCCLAMLSEVSEVLERVPGAEIYVFHTDIRSFGKGAEELYRKVRESGHVTFIHGKVSNVTETAGGSLLIKAHDDMLGSLVEVPVDLLVLSTGLQPSPGADELARKLNIVRGPDGFFLEAHPKLRPLDTATDGVFLAGVAQGPKDITDAVSQGSGAASRASVPMAKGKVEIESIFAVVDKDRCSGCRICEAVCAYSAIKVEEVEGGKLQSKITEAQCKGCGACCAACPSGAISMKHFTDRQLLAMIRTVCA